MMDGRSTPSFFKVSSVTDNPNVWRNSYTRSSSRSCGLVGSSYLSSRNLANALMYVLHMTLTRVLNSTSFQNAYCDDATSPPAGPAKWTTSSCFGSLCFLGTACRLTGESRCVSTEALREDVWLTSSCTVVWTSDTWSCVVHTFWKAELTLARKTELILTRSSHVEHAWSYVTCEGKCWLYTWG